MFLYLDNICVAGSAAVRYKYGTLFEEIDIFNICSE